MVAWSDRRESGGRAVLDDGRRVPEAWRWLLGVLAAAVLASAAWALPLDEKVRRAVDGAGLKNATVGVSVIDLASGDDLASLNAGTPLIPASNMKVLTTGAALRVLGPDFSFRTEIFVSGRRLVVKGSGDPALGDADVLRRYSPPIDVSDMLADLTSSVIQSGASAFDEIVVDDRVFDREFVHPDWPKDQINEWYCAPVAGVNFHANVLAVYPRPGEGGGPPQIVYEPQARAVSFLNKARTVTTGRNAIWVSREDQTNRYTLHGDVRSAIQYPVKVAVFEPPTLLGEMLRDRLERAGVAVGIEGTDLPRVRPPGPLEDFPVTRACATIVTPMSDVLSACNTDSNNLYAEALLKRMAHQVSGEPGSWAGGASVLRMVLGESLGPDDAASTTVADGSGMSRNNLVTAGTLARFLRSLHRDSNLRGIFLASLAEPGEGTLAKRFRDRKPRNEVYAKSGSIRSVRCLSGYVIGPDGRGAAFSVLVNGMPEGQALLARQLHEQIVLIVDDWVSRRDVAAHPNGE